MFNAFPTAIAQRHDANLFFFSFSFLFGKKSFVGTKGERHSFGAEKRIVLNFAVSKHTYFLQCCCKGLDARTFQHAQRRTAFIQVCMSLLRTSGESDDTIGSPSCIIAVGGPGWTFQT